MIERWDWKDRDHVEQFTGKGFVAIDPGACGCVLGYRAGTPIPALQCSPNEPTELVKVVRDVDAALILYEAQYAHPKTAQAILELSFKTGIAIGWLACARHPLHVTNLMQIAPATWQAHQRRNVGVQPKRGQGIEIAFQRAQAFGQSVPLFALWWQSSTKVLKEGLASALGLAEWWLEYSSK